jgi:hypothetical protein
MVSKPHKATEKVMPAMTPNRNVYRRVWLFLIPADLEKIPVLVLELDFGALLSNGFGDGDSDILPGLIGK